MAPLERLRLAVALAHAVWGAELHLRTDDGESIMVSHRPAADIDPCVMRRVVVASACPAEPDLAARVGDIEISGALTDLGGGVLSSCIDGVEQRWVASLLHVDRVTKLLGDLDAATALHRAVRITVQPDRDLGVSIVKFALGGSRSASMLDEMAAQAAAACFVEELRCAAMNESDFDRGVVGGWSTSRSERGHPSG